MLDIKLKSNKLNRLTGILVSLLLLTLISFGIMAFYPVFSKNANHLMEKFQEQDEELKNADNESYKSEFMNSLFRGNYALYWDVKNKVNPAKIFVDDSLYDQLHVNNEINILINEEDEIADEYVLNFEYSNLREFIQTFKQILDQWYYNFFTYLIDAGEMEYYIIDHVTDNILTNATIPLNIITENTEEAEFARSDFSFYSVFEYDEDGNLNVPLVYGLEEKYISAYKILELAKNPLRSELGEDLWSPYLNYIKSPKDVTIIYASKSDSFYIPYGYGISGDSRWREDWAFLNSGFKYAFVISLCMVTLLAFVLPMKKEWALGEGIESKVPLEIGFIGGVIIMDCIDGLCTMAKETISGDFLGFSYYSILPDWTKKVFDYGVNYFLWMVVFTGWFIIVLSFRSVFQLGIKAYLKERTLASKILKWTKVFIKKIYASLTNFDLKDNNNRTIFKFLVANFVVLTLLCSIWLLGIIGLILYTIGLFFVIRKYMEDIKEKYAILLNATSNMAKGDLEVSVDEDLGVFNSLKEELTKIQYGFKRAVEEETKSQKMKTELITNVSHDLKTPLTAIITYINLLKEENITEEDRKSYIETLDQKSLRLKKLIEDLFEISKATSHNITLNLVDVELISLIKQVQLEMFDKIKESNIDFRNQFEVSNVVLKLDSEKTYRIFENLFVNIVKYAMPGTRAYIELSADEDEVTVVVKNISAAELTFSAEEITERFVRGDASRNTEGSGLGLAIVKNFVELQGGIFKIQLDGDLFKAIIKWKR